MSRPPHRPNSERPLWFVQNTRSSDEWERCDFGRRLDTDTADLLLDHVFERLSDGDITGGVACLIEGFEHLALSTDRASWRRFKRSVWSIHPLSLLIWQPEIRACVGAEASANHGIAALIGLEGPEFLMRGRPAARRAR